MLEDLVESASHALPPVVLTITMRVLQVCCFGGDTRGNRPAVTTGESKRWSSVLNENIALRQQVSEMEDFLEDHGLVWVGTGAILSMPLFLIRECFFGEK